MFFHLKYGYIDIPFLMLKTPIENKYKEESFGYIESCMA